MRSSPAGGRPAEAAAHSIGRTVAVEIAAALAATTSLTDLVATLQQHLKWLLPATRVLLCLPEDDGRRYRVIAGGDAPSDALYPLTEGVIGWTLAHDASLDLPDVRDAARLPPGVNLGGADQRGGSLLVLPLRARDSLVGVLAIGSPRPDAYAAIDHGLINLVALQVAATVYTAQLIDREQRARAMAEEAVRVRDQFLSTVSHDLKSPLTTIKGRVQLLRQRLSATPTPEGERLAADLSRIDQTAARMTRLIDELLDVARLQAGQPLALDPHPVDLAALVRRMVTEYQDVSRRHRIRVETPAPAVLGVFDPSRLERVLDNLLSNSIKYSPTGGDITVRLREEGDTAILEVRDRGLGIPAADLPHIFERFRRAGNVGRASGTGLGLTGTRQIVEKHGGTIAVDSEEGAGTTVTVRLPLRAEDAPERPG